MAQLMGHILMTLGGIGAYVSFLLIRPQTRCWFCRGWGTKGRRRNICRWCSGTGTRFRLGARLVHRGVALAIRHFLEWRNER